MKMKKLKDIRSMMFIVDYKKLLAHNKSLHTDAQKARAREFKRYNQK